MDGGAPEDPRLSTEQYLEKHQLNELLEVRLEHHCSGLGRVQFTYTHAFAATYVACMQAMLGRLGLSRLGTPCPNNTRSKHARACPSRVD